ncbi:hypothetical protein KI387_023602, partial [Taxus chinensis]
LNLKHALSLLRLEKSQEDSGACIFMFLNLENKVHQHTHSYNQVAITEYEYHHFLIR